jgi:hypothetical protein
MTQVHFYGGPLDRKTLQELDPPPFHIYAAVGWPDIFAALQSSPSPDATFRSVRYAPIQVTWHLYRRGVIDHIAYVLEDEQE